MLRIRHWPNSSLTISWAWKVSVCWRTMDLCPSVAQPQGNLLLPHMQSTQRSRNGRQNPTLSLLSLPLFAFLLIPLLALILRVELADLLASLRTTTVAYAVRLSLTTTLLSLLITLL